VDVCLDAVPDSSPAKLLNDQTLQSIHPDQHTGAAVFRIPAYIWMLAPGGKNTPAG
jgi:hypothetical protein